MTRARVVLLPRSGHLADLLERSAPSLVYSGREQRHCGQRPDLTSWAGLLAAKLAVADELALTEFDPAEAVATGRDIGLGDIEILPDRSACANAAGCTSSHPPVIHLGDRHVGRLPPGVQLAVSISHTASLATALVANLASRTENHS